MINSPIEEIKNRLDIVEVIGSYLKLQKTGANFRAICPFHSEKKPSFFVSPTRQIWHCFGCNAGGDIFKFIMAIEGMEFGDALRMLAQKAGVELKPISQELKTERARLYEICELATRFFEKQLNASKAGNQVKKYLWQRGITEESIKKWRLGYAPDSWKSLSDFLISKGYQREEIVKAGLAIPKDIDSNSLEIRSSSQDIRSNSQDIYDRFRGRIIFPIFDLNSQVIGFGGRLQPGDQGRTYRDEIAKYINTPNTILYDKSKVLYGLDKAKMEIRKKGECILVEGYTDVILVSQSGNTNVVATSGTALTPYQLKILKRYSENLLIAFDMDIAGDSATKRGIDLAQLLGFNIKVVLLPQNLDPADIISQNPKEWSEFLEKAKSILDFYFETTFSALDSKTPEGKKAISKILLPVIKRIDNDIERSFWIQELAKRLEVKEEAVIEELKKVKLEKESYGLGIEESQPLAEPEKGRGSLPKSRKELLEERLLTLILKSPENLKELSEGDLEFFSPPTAQILSCWKKNSQIEGAKLPAELTDFVNYLFLKAEVEPIEVDPLEEFGNCFRELKFLEIKKRLDQTSREIKEAEEARDLEKIEKLLQKFNSYSKLLSNLEVR